MKMRNPIYVTYIFTRSMRMIVISKTLWMILSEGKFGKRKKKN